MKHLARFSLLGMLVAGCGANPLLKIAAADYAPLTVGSTWTYVSPSGAAAFTTKVLASSVLAGIGFYSVDNYAGIPGTSSVWVTGSAIRVGASVDRKLPYVVGNRWELSSPANVTAFRSVDGTENIDTPAGIFTRCFRLKTEIKTYDSVADLTTTTGTFIWAAPNVGDVQYADVDAAGAMAVTAKLSSYSLVK